MGKPKLLDLFCGAGGCSMGYHRAGFDVVGVDINPQPRYPFEFMQADVMSLDVEFLKQFDAIHASPPCQRYSTMGNWARDKAKHPDLIDNVRQKIIQSQKPYIIENVPGSPLQKTIMLCGSMFNLGVIRHRLFECSIDILLDGLRCNHKGKFYTVLTKSCRPTTSMFAKSSVAKGREAMGIDWMSQYEMGEAIPPAYTEFIGKQLIKHVQEVN